MPVAQNNAKTPVPALSSFLTLHDAGAEKIKKLIALARGCKHTFRSSTTLSKTPQRLVGKTVALLFEKASTRTRCSFETAAAEEGAHAVFLSKHDLQLGQKETIEDTARALGRMFSAIVFRGFAHATCAALQNNSGVPVINALTDNAHPTQALADIMTLEEHFGADLYRQKHKRGDTITICYIGDAANNVATSLITICAMLGISIRIAAPKKFYPPQQVLAAARTHAKKSGSSVDISDDIERMVRNTDGIYTDVWTSMGEEHRAAHKKRALRAYQVNAALMKKAASHAVFLHCLPVVRGEEVTAGVIDGTQSLVWEQAENRKHTIKALLLACLS